VTRFLLHNSWVRLALVLPLFGGAVVLLWWRGPDWDAVADVFTVVHWWWIVAALGLNLASVVSRSLSWQTAIHQALPPPHPPYPKVFSAFAVGLLANAVLPGRVGELARVAVLTRRLPRGHGSTAMLLGTVFAHRLFDLIPALLLIAYVLATARIPDWAIVSLELVAGVGVVLFAGAVVLARVRHRPLEATGRVRRLLGMARRGLGVMRSPIPAAVAILFQCVGWFLQLLAVYVAMRAFGIHEPLPAAGLVLLLMNVATIFPLWPGNFGLLQAAVAFPLVSYGVAYARGFAYGLGLQVMEMSVGVGVGLLFLAREGLSFAMLRRMEAEAGAEAEPGGLAGDQSGVTTTDGARTRARVPG
jgi:uncharacterized membrane protein YbhN (UPF0104 family)